ncbi:MAG: hypothetical protein KatS3mg012_0714 [Gaiellaceae bacterium]|jgi:hypothetical protein|nr:MAG: hypothetical protein KatS3mg012_0714 [Gaiellaceae bacterium]
MRRASSTFSFAEEWLAGELTPSDLLGRIAHAGAPDGIEVIGHQLWRAFPELDHAEIRSFRALLEELELEPAALGIYVDLFRRSDRRLTHAEALEELGAQVEMAGRLSFPVARIPSGVPLEVLEGIAPRAERAGVVVATEVQGDQRPDDPAVAPLLELLERLSSPGLGLVLDFSVAMRRVPSTFVSAVLEAGFPADALEDVISRWERGARTGEILRMLERSEAPQSALDLARSGFVRFGRQDPEAWRPYVPSIVHVHAKVWELDSLGDDPATRDAELIAVLREGGYDRFVCSEWGGGAWLEADEVDPFALARQHHAHLARLIEQTSPVLA